MRIANCWIVAMWLWAASEMKSYAWIRRSYAFLRAIPHFGVAEAIGWRYLRTIEFIPPKRRLWTRKNWLLCFEGSYRVCHFRLVAVRRWATKEEALADLYWGKTDP